MGLAYIPGHNPWAKAGELAAQGIQKGGERAINQNLLNKGLENLKQLSMNPDASPIDILAGVSQAFAHHPEGHKYAAAYAPLLLQEQQRNKNIARLQGVTNPETSQQSPTQQPPAQALNPIGQNLALNNRPTQPFSQPNQVGQTLQQAPPKSIEQRLAEKELGYLRQGRTDAEAKQLARTDIDNEQAQANREFDKRQTYKKEFDQRYNETWPEKKDAQGNILPSGLAEPLRVDMEKDFARLSESGVNGIQAWDKLFAEYSGLQASLDKVTEEGGKRNQWMAPGTDELSKFRELIKPIAEKYPSLAKDYLRDRAGFGSSDASEVLRPRTKQFDRFIESMRSPYKEAQAKGQLGIFRPDKFVNEKLEPALRKYLVKDFNPSRDSLEQLHAAAVDMGMSDERYNQIVNEMFPGGAGLDSYNQGEMSKELQTDHKPPLYKIFTGNFWSQRISRGISNKR